MTSERRLPRGRRALHVLTGVKAAALSSLLLLAVVGGLTSHATEPVRDDSASTGDRVLLQAMADHGCSATGLGGEIPSSALIRTASGRVRQVGFDRGWASYTGIRPGTLLAVCSEPVAPRPQRAAD